MIIDGVNYTAGAPCPRCLRMFGYNSALIKDWLPAAKKCDLRCVNCHWPFNHHPLELPGGKTGAAI